MTNDIELMVYEFLSMCYLQAGKPPVQNEPVDLSVRAVAPPIAVNGE